MKSRRSCASLLPLSLELTYRKQVESLAWKQRGCGVGLLEGWASSVRCEQEGTGDPMTLSAGRREQPCHGGPGQSPAPTLAPRMPSKSLSLGERSWSVLDPEKVASAATGRGTGGPSAFC